MFLNFYFIHYNLSKFYKNTLIGYTNFLMKEPKIYLKILTIIKSV